MASLSGCVKWFNSKHKYGFITVLSDGEYKNTDVFVHQSNIITKEPCYRFLVAGENIKFDIKSTDNEKHPIQAINIIGMNNVSLKCEIPKEPRQYNEGYQGGRRYPSRGGFSYNGGNQSNDNNQNQNQNQNTSNGEGFRRSDSISISRGRGGMGGRGGGMGGRGGGMGGNRNNTGTTAS
jgi:cold shock CspA family protein